MHDAGSTLVVFLFGDPHLLEGRQRAEDRAPNPHGILALGRRYDLDLHGAGHQRRDFLHHPVSDAWSTASKGLIVNSVITQTRTDNPRTM